MNVNDAKTESFPLAWEWQRVTIIPWTAVNIVGTVSDRDTASFAGAPVARNRIFL